jgi:hypothetical protein
MRARSRVGLLGSLIAALCASTFVAPPPASAAAGTVIYGSIVGTDAGIPVRDYWAGNPDYGRAPALYGILYTNQVTMGFIQDTAVANKVPWPKAEGTNLDLVEHNVYMLWGKKDSGAKILFKYGITKTSLGDVRPKRQLPDCRSHMKALGDDDPECSWMWLRRETARRLEARRIEAAYFTEYTIRHDGDCPPGATKCM